MSAKPMIADFETLVDDFEFLDDWEERYRHLIELGRAMPEFPPERRVLAYKVEGCASEVWLHLQTSHGRLEFAGDSDAHIVRGLIAVLRSLYQGRTLSQVAALDPLAELGRLNLEEHLSKQRSNGLRAMLGRIRSYAISEQKN